MSLLSTALSSIAARLPRVLAIPTVVATGALLAACGGSDPASNAAAGENGQEQKAETKLADFARCMREHGVNAETASGPGGGHGLKISPGKAGASPAAMEAAQKACARYRPEPKRVNLSPQQKVELRRSGAEVRQVHARTRHQSGNEHLRRRRPDRHSQRPAGAADRTPKARASRRRRAPARGFCRSRRARARERRSRPRAANLNPARPAAER